MNLKIFLGILVVFVIIDSTQSRRFKLNRLNQKLWPLLGKREREGKNNCVCDEKSPMSEEPEVVEKGFNCLEMITGTKEWVTNGCWRSNYLPYPY